MKFCQSLMYAAPDQWIELTCAAEAAGFDQVALSDHVVQPEKLESTYPYTRSGRPMFPPDTPWPDVWVTIGALAARTERISFVTHVYVLPARNPFVVAKAVGTAAVLSGGRVQLGVGAGWMREEFAALEQPFERRGARMEEQIEVLRTLWRGGMVEHHGEFYDFDRLEMAPAPPEPVPILIGGHSEVALRRAARIGDGWIGVYYRLDELLAIVERLQEMGDLVRAMIRHAGPAVRDPGLGRRPHADARGLPAPRGGGRDDAHDLGVADGRQAERAAGGEPGRHRALRRRVHRAAAGRLRAPGPVP